MSQCLAIRLTDIHELTESDEGLLTFLEGLRTWVASSSRGLYKSLQSTVVGDFLDAEKTSKRVGDLLSDRTDSVLKEHARKLLDVWDRHPDR